ncbi:beta-fructofuranosidase, insoluble isoenzyme 1-like isoform X2 [Nymphaea colorata]|nr:beta-fructofuranosidase, insoluble isoenzyme 1-like isoform X2 [Nymphaea colorata]
MLESFSLMGASRICFSFVAFLICNLLSIHGVQASHQVFQELMSVSPNSSANQLHRTGYHFQPPMHWINDPNGPVYYKGLYHFFYQYNPYGSIWGNIIWAHSISTDLINWFPLEPALVPSEPFDIAGCWSGSATILPGEKPAILYTGLNSSNVQLQNIAFPKDPSDPFLREWVKPSYNPVMAPTTSNGINASAFRDPTTAWLGPDGMWRTLVGSKVDQKGIAILYRSSDFINWTMVLEPLHSSEGTGMWECPDFYPVPVNGTVGLDTSVTGPRVKHVLKVSLDDKKIDYYTVGTYLHREDKYVPDNTSPDDATGFRYDYGKFYASKTFFDSQKNRRILWGWINESDSFENDVHKGWAGVQAIPRKVWLDESGKQLVQWPVEELEGLRGERASVHNKRIESGSTVQVKGVQASQADVEVSFQVDDLNKAEVLDDPDLLVNPQGICSEKGAAVKGGVGPFGLLLFASHDLQEQTAVFFRVFKRPNSNHLVVVMCSDQSKSTLEKDVDKTTYGGFVDVHISDGHISLRTLIDNSIVESFGGGGKTCITARVYPKLAVGNDARLYVFNNGSSAVTLSKLTAWSMRKPSIN